MVLSQSPAGGHEARKGSTVTMTVGALGTETTPTTPTTHDADDHDRRPRRPRPQPPAAERGDDGR